MKKMSKTIKNSGDSSVVFFGTGPVAAKSLELLAQNFFIEAVVTKPKPASHKGSFPVLDAATKLGLPLKTVTDKASLSKLIQEKPFKSSLGVLIDFGIIVSQDVIDYFSLGIVNSHFSLLPEWRGADPITFAVLSGQQQTGVSLMLLVEKMDEGPLLATAPYEIPANTTTPDLTQALIEVSNTTLETILPLYVDGKITPYMQDETPVPTYSRKLSKEDGIIDWQKPAEQLEREIRAYLGWPGSRTTLAGKDVIITKAHVVPVNHQGKKPGDVEVVSEAGAIMVECGSGTLCIERLKPAGKNEMSAQAFLAGHKHLF